MLRINCRMWTVMALLGLGACDPGTAASESTEEKAQSDGATLEPTADGRGMARVNQGGSATTKINAGAAGAQAPASAAAGSGGTNGSAASVGVSTMQPAAASSSGAAGANAAGTKAANAAGASADPECGALRSCCSTLLDTR